jgi:hypothetical protein
VPILPAADLLSTCWLREFAPRSKDGKAASRKTGAFKAALVAVIAAWAFLSFFNAQWPNSGWGTAIDTPRYRWMVYSRNYYGFDHRPFDDDWSVPDIVRTVANRQPVLPVLGVVVNLPYLNPSSVSLYARLLANRRGAPPLIDVRWVVEPAMIDRLDDCDYVLVRTGLDKADWVAKVEWEVERLIRDNPDRFIRDSSFAIPLKDAEAIVYRHEKAATGIGR